MTSSSRILGGPGTRAAAAALALCLGGLSASIAHAEGSPAPTTQTSTDAAGDKAREHFRAAKAFYQEGKYIEALAEFKKAYELKPAASLSYNIARCYEQLSQWQDAITAYEKFITETSDPRERTEALDKIEFLKSKLAPDSASPEGRYKARIEAGKKAFSRGDYEAAIQEFKAAFDLKASPGVLFNIAKAYERMARYEEAIDYYTQYLDLDPNASDRPDVEESIRRLKKSIRERFQELTVNSEPTGADIYLDDRNTGLQGQTNFRFKVSPGPHTLYIDLNGFEPVKRDFVMPDDKPLALEFQLKKLTNVGYAEIKVNVDGAQIFVDGAIVGLSPYKLKKALPAGNHQVTVEARGFPRVSQEFNIVRDQNTVLDIVLERPAERVSDDTLSSWGRNFLILGIIGGGLGVVGPFAYQKLVIRRPLNAQIGPHAVAWGPGVQEPAFWNGVPKVDGAPKEEIEDTDLSASLRENSTERTLSTIQFWSVVGGSILCAAGLGFYIYSWTRPDQPALADYDTPRAPSVEITAFGISPEPDGGATVGLSGRF